MKKKSLREKEIAALKRVGKRMAKLFDTTPLTAAQLVVTVMYGFNVGYTRQILKEAWLSLEKIEIFEVIDDSTIDRIAIHDE